MAGFSEIQDRGTVGALLPEEVSKSFLTNLQQGSVVLQNALRVPVARKQVRFPVLSQLPRAYFVNGDTGLKQTTKQGWDNVTMTVEEIAVILPIPDAVSDDVDFDLFGESEKNLATAVAQAFDAAVLFGQDAPDTYPGAIVTQAVAKGLYVVRGTRPATEGGLAGDFSDLFSKIEKVGYGVRNVVAPIPTRGLLRGVRDANGVLLQEINTAEVYGAGINYLESDLWEEGAASETDIAASDVEAIAGDWSKLAVGVRQDVSFTILKEGVISDNAGKVILNLAQQDSKAIRVVFRAGVAIPNPATSVHRNRATRFPFGVLLAPGTDVTGIAPAA